MRKQWEFSGASEGWYWRATDVVTGALVQHAQSCFRTLSECLRDAEAHGYDRSSNDKHAYRIGQLPYTASNEAVARVRRRAKTPKAEYLRVE
jgi:hypothetical protein